jgi:hypothetical protein
MSAQRKTHGVICVECQRQTETTDLIAYSYDGRPVHKHCAVCGRPIKLLLADEVHRRDPRSHPTPRPHRAPRPQMQLQARDNSTDVTYDRQLWAELTSLRFLADAHNVLVMGPVGVEKTFLANALGHIAVRRGHSVHTERADKLFKRLTAARLDATYEDEMRRLHRVELLILDDLGLHRLETTETSDFYELIVERHRHASTITTSNREPPEILAMMADPPLAQSAIDQLQSAAYELVTNGTQTAVCLLGRSGGVVAGRGRCAAGSGRASR